MLGFLDMCIIRYATGAANNLHLWGTLLIASRMDRILLTSDMTHYIGIGEELKEVALEPS
jgi:hypothetical protein